MIRSKAGMIFQLFWENSKINKRNILKIAKRLDEDARVAKSIPQIFYPTEDLKLQKPKDFLARLMSKRKSTRSFSEKPVTEKQMGSLFYSFAQVQNGRRILPSAGGKYPIEVYAFLFNVKSKLNKNIVYYNVDNHSLSIVKKCPLWESAREQFGLYLEGMPAIFFIFVAIPRRTMDKYEERGGRFVLIETGIYAQSLALRVEFEDLCGVLSGALHDDDVKTTLGLENTDTIVTLGYACGHKK